MLEMKKLYFPDTVERYEKFILEAFDEACTEECAKLEKSNLNPESALEYYKMLKEMAHTLAQTVLNNWDNLVK